MRSRRPKEVRDELPERIYCVSCSISLCFVLVVTIILASGAMLSYFRTPEYVRAVQECSHTERFAINSTAFQQLIAPLNSIMCSGEGAPSADERRTCVCDGSLAGPRCAACSLTCSGRGSVPGGECATATPACDCNAFYTGSSCETCPPQFDLENGCASCGMCDNAGRTNLCGSASNLCVESTSTASCITGYSCVCHDGSTGPSCRNCTSALRKDPPACSTCTLCETNPCQNGGTCTVREPCTLPTDFSCSCAGNWTGSICDQCLFPRKLDTATGTVCAECASEANSPFCNGAGTLQYAGADCQTQICSCNTGFTGDRCQKCTSGRYGLDCVALTEASCGGGEPGVSLATGNGICKCNSTTYNATPTSCVACPCVGANTVSGSSACTLPSGACVSACLPGWKGPNCDQADGCVPVRGTPDPDDPDKCAVGSCVGGHAGSACQLASTCANGVTASPPAGIPSTSLTTALACNIGTFGCRCHGSECWWGDNCDKVSACDHGLPDFTEAGGGGCAVCSPGWQGPNCTVASLCVHGQSRGVEETSGNRECASGSSCDCFGDGECWYGPLCNQTVTCSPEHGTVNHTTDGTGVCDPASCVHGRWGPTCQPCTCNVASGARCDPSTGECEFCTDQFLYGPNCDASCIHCMDPTDPLDTCINTPFPRDNTWGTCVSGEVCADLVGAPVSWNCTYAAEYTPAAGGTSGTSRCTNCAHAPNQRETPGVDGWTLCPADARVHVAGGVEVCEGGKCDPGYYGPFCDTECACVGDRGTCANDIFGGAGSGECIPGSCTGGWSGPFCVDSQCRALSPGRLQRISNTTGLCEKCLPGASGSLCLSCTAATLNSTTCAPPLATFRTGGRCAVLAAGPTLLLWGERIDVVVPAQTQALGLFGGGALFSSGQRDFSSGLVQILYFVLDPSFGPLPTVPSVDTGALEYGFRVPWVHLGGLVVPAATFSPGSSCPSAAFPCVYCMLVLPADVARANPTASQMREMCNAGGARFLSDMSSIPSDGTCPERGTAPLDFSFPA